MDRFELLSEEHLRLIAVHGFVIHSVIGEGHHTHGLVKTFDHPEFEITLDIRPELARSIFWQAVAAIKTGKRFAPNTTHNGLANLPIRAVAAGLRIRLILPDAKGRVELPMDAPYARQYDLPL